LRPGQLSRPDNSHNPPPFFLTLLLDAGSTRVCPFLSLLFSFFSPPHLPNFSVHPLFHPRSFFWGGVLAPSVSCAHPIYFFFSCFFFFSFFFFSFFPPGFFWRAQTHLTSLFSPSSLQVCLFSSHSLLMHQFPFLLWPPFTLLFF